MSSKNGGNDSIAWREWGAAAFDEARALDRPILLSATAAWSADTRALERRVFSNPPLAALVAETLVPVRFDADRLPHVRDRYNSAGWPITALLTPHGDVLWAGHATGAEQLRGVIGQATQAWRARRDEIEEEMRRRELAGASTRARSGGGIVRREAADDVLTAAQASFDARNGGFGESFKMLAPDIIELLLMQGHALDNPDWIEMATRTLDGMIAGEIFDHARGGFHRLTRQPDWTEPSTEKLLETNAWALRSFGFAGHVMDRSDWREIAQRTVEWVDATLGLPDGLWGGSQAADADFHAGNSSEPPAVDRTMFTDACAQWIVALADVGGRLGHDAWIDRAARALDALLVSMRAQDGLLYHYRAEHEAPACAGLLSDVAETARACLAVAQATGDARWTGEAGALADAMMRHFWASDGGFCDIASAVEKVAGLRHETRPFETNAAAAGLLVDLTVLENGRVWRAPAERSLAVLSPMAGRYGIAAAGFALAVEHHFESARSFVVVGSGVAAERLRRAALSVPVLDRQVWTLPHGGTVGGRRFEPAEPAVVYACSSRRCSAPITRPEELSTASTSAR